MTTQGRPATMKDDDVIAVSGLTARSLLQEGSERRALIVRLVDMGGRARVSELNAAYGYDVRARLRSLVGAGWLTHLDAENYTALGHKMPRRPAFMRSPTQ